MEGATVSSPIEFAITAIIDTRDSLRFDEPSPLQLAEPSFNSVTISGDGRLTVAFNGSASTIEQAGESVVKALDRLANLIAFKYNVPAVPIGIVTMRWKDGEERHAESEGQLKFWLDAVLTKIGVSDAKQPPLSGLERKVYSPDCDGMLSAYRQARNEQNPALRYLLFYRLLESHLKGETAIDAWIRTKRPTVVEVPDRSGKNRTIHTHLRNKIHPGGPGEFPYTQVTAQLEDLHSLVRDLLSDECM